jgi:hypothetical protein
MMMDRAQRKMNMLRADDMAAFLENDPCTPGSAPMEITAVKIWYHIRKVTFLLSSVILNHAV